MKKSKIILVALVMLICVGIGLFIYRNSNTLRGTDGLVKKAQEVFPVAQNHVASISYAGLCGNDDEAIVWFISDDGYGGQDYWVMNCKIIGTNAYMFLDWSRPKVYAKDIVSYLWNGANTFLINDDNCAAIRYTNNHGEVIFEDKIKKDSFPYLYEHRTFSGKTDFIDYNGEYIF